MGWYEFLWLLGLGLVAAAVWNYWEEIKLWAARVIYRVFR